MKKISPILTDENGVEVTRSPYHLTTAILSLLEELVDVDGTESSDFDQIRHAIREHRVMGAVEADQLMGDDRPMALFSPDIDEALFSLREAKLNERDIEYLRDGTFRRLPPIVVGQVIMQALGDYSIRSPEGAKFWIDVLHELSGDWVMELKRVARWMDLTDKIGWDQLKDAIVD